MNKTRLIKRIEIYAETFNLIRSGNIDIPSAKSLVESTEFYISGWVLGRYYQAREIDVVYNESILRRVSLNKPRPDVFIHYPTYSDELKCGFEVVVPVLKMPDNFKIELMVIFENNKKEKLGTILAESFIPISLQNEKGKTRIIRIPNLWNIYKPLQSFKEKIKSII